MRAVFCGTPAAAVPTLESLAAIADIRRVVTQPDRPRGRSGKAQPPPVKESAERMGLDVAQPSRGRELTAILSECGSLDVAVVVAFGMLVPPGALSIPTAGFVNVHFSLLPRWRGAAPVHRAVLAGETRTGVTLMQMDDGLDTGPTLVTTSTAIGPRETASALTERLAVMGGGLLGGWLPAIVGGEVLAIRQDATRATTAPKLRTEERWIDPAWPASRVLAAVRGLDPWPGAWFRHTSGSALRILEAEPGSLSLAVGEVSHEAERVEVGVGHGSVRLLVVQPEGGSPMDASAWMRGRQDGPGRVG